MSISVRLAQQVEKEQEAIKDIHSYEILVRRLKVLSKSQTALLKVRELF